MSTKRRSDRHQYCGGAPDLPDIDSHTALIRDIEVVGCPECAAGNNDNGGCDDSSGVVESLRPLMQANRILIFNRRTRSLCGGDGVTGICMNGNCVQITIDD